MQEDFSIVWDRLQRTIKRGMKIDNWGLSRGYTKNTFKIYSIDSNYVVCDPPKAKSLQYVPKDDFLKIWEIWGDYMNEKVQRKFIRDYISRFSSYIISIYRFLKL